MAAEIREGKLQNGENEPRAQNAGVETSVDGLSSSTNPLNPSRKPLPQILEDGVTELWCPPDPAQILADICFVHGLMGHPWKTWYHGKVDPIRGGASDSNKKRFSLSRITSRRSVATQNSEAIGNSAGSKTRNDKGCYWPLDLVPNDFDNVRVLTYGYDSHPSHFLADKTTQMNITQHAHKLLQQVTNARIDCLDRPLIFVAHSLGGILVKDAVVQSGKYENHLQALSQSCFAIFFFGTPHRGSNAARYGEILGSVIGALPSGISIYKEVLRGLKPNGEKLSLVEGDFNLLLDKNIPADQKIQIYSFQEGKAVTSLKLFDGKVVPDSSSFFNRKDVEQHSFVNENHMDIARIRSAHAQAYVDFKAALSGYLAKIRARVEQAKSHARQIENEQRAFERKALMEALEFKERCIRQQQVAGLETTNMTFTWLWTSPFNTWLENDAPLFWISGKPASGKSTLMNYIAQARDTVNVLQSTHHTKWKIIYFFFDFRAGDGIGNNVEGFLRCLLYQICQELPDVSRLVPELGDFVKTSRGRSLAPSAINIPLDILKKALVRGIQSYPQSLLILLDGLDEYEGQKIELTNFIKALCSANVKICTASRPEPPFPDAFAGIPSFQMHELNFLAINNFGLDILKQFYSSRQYDQSALQTLADDVAHKSQGVFLWARFAIFELIDGLTHGEKVGSSALEQRLNAVPRELQAIYSRIFRRCSPTHRKTAGLLLLLICHKEEAVSVDMLEEAIHLIPPSSPLSVDFGATLSIERDDNTFSKRLLAVTGGTVEILEARATFCRNTFPCSLPRLIHRTVNTYLELNGWREILGDIFHPALGPETWLQICTRAILKEGSNLRSRFPFHDHQGAQPQEQYVLTTQEVTGFLPPEGEDGHPSSNQDDDEGFLASLSEPRPTERARADMLLLANVAMFAFHYAASFERLSGKSSLSVTTPFTSSEFVKLHTDLSWNCHCEKFATFSELYVDMEPEPVHLAIFHELIFYVEEYLDNQREAVRAKSPKTVIGKLLNAMRHDNANVYAEHLRMLKDLGTFCLFRTSDGSIPVLELLLQHCPTVEDYEILAAVSRQSPELLRMLLKYRKSDIRNLKLDGPRLRLSFYDPTDYQGKQLGPLSAIDNRSVEDAELIIDMLMERGVQVNGPCGPLGGPIHYFLASRPRISNNPLLHLLVRKGADINQSGAEGNPLEFCWRRANTQSTHGGHFDHNAHGQYRSLLRQLIDLGAVNNRKDPNGLVPSVAQMRLFACNYTDLQECRRFYMTGPRDGGSTWPGPVPLHADDANRVDDEMDLPYEKAMEEYRAAMGSD